MVERRAGIDYIQGKQMALSQSRYGSMQLNASDVVAEQPDPHTDDGWSLPGTSK